MDRWESLMIRIDIDPSKEQAHSTDKCLESIKGTLTSDVKNKPEELAQNK
ncbi:MAG: hypothetical protein OSB25_05440 [Salibacteraceae bacterium]|nr:hypothetical protein [Salibacteraceae bacterium]